VPLQEHYFQRVIPKNQNLHAIALQEELVVLDLQILNGDPTIPTINNFGRSVAISGNNAVVGVPTVGNFPPPKEKVFVFDVSKFNLLQTIEDPIGTPGQFGGDVETAISGNKVVVGIPAIDSAKLYDVSTGDLLQDFQTPASQINFGSSVAISGNNVLVGAPLFGSGRAYLFDASTGNLLRTFIQTSPFSDGGFGISVAISGNRVLLGDPGDDQCTRNCGKAFLYDTGGNLLRTFGDPTGATDGAFGTLVSISGNRVLVGEPSGFVHLFTAFPGNFIRTIDYPGGSILDSPKWSWVTGGVPGVGSSKV